ncbi:MAG: calcium/sodium antiporter [Bacteroidales bacterium]|nr:calcium/sodium antiporter [Bacteroidales bacterium]
MFLQIVLLIAGLALVVFGADWLVDGASGIARRAGISEFVIGLTIVGFGTSCPELVVSLTGAFKGLADISIGNVVGSNIYNTLLILGLTSMIAPMAITRVNQTRDIPLVFGVTLLFILFGIFNNDISRLEGIMFLLIFAAYIWYCFKFTPRETESETNEKQLKLWQAICLVLVGLGGLIGGGQLFVNSATAIAKMLGVSDKFIAITILALGTSLPELATCIVAAAKHKGQLALGNILGSNIFNILLIIGASAVVTPLSFASMNYVDLGVLMLSTILLFSSCFVAKKDMIDRVDASFMLLCQAAYMAWLFISL